jgi:hypothetical protein
MVIQNKSDNSTVHHAVQSCQIRMVLQNKSDNSNGHALNWTNFRLNLSFCRCLSHKHTHFCENFLGNENFRKNFRFRKISWKFAHLRIIFAFRENGKNRFRFNPTPLWHVQLCHWHRCATNFVENFHEWSCTTVFYAGIWFGCTHGTVV